jgi:hypothetical protein
MKLSNKIKEEIRDLALIMALLILFCICFSVVSAQNMLGYEMGLPEIELNLESTSSKPQNKFVARKQVNNQATVFIAGAALTGFGIYQLTARRSYNFDSRSVKGAVPLNPHNMLIGVGLFTMSISLVIQ